MRSLLLIGCGGHSKSIIDIVESIGGWEIYGLIGMANEIGNTIFGHKVIGCDEDLYHLFEKCSAATVAIGQLPDSSRRREMVTQLEKIGFEMPTLISPNAVVSRHAKIGRGTTLGHGTVVNAGAVIGNHCIINNCALIEHDTVIEDYCHISTGALVNGGVTVGFGSFIGSGCMLREGISIPALTVVGAGKRVMGWPLKHQ